MVNSAKADSAKAESANVDPTDKKPSWFSPSRLLAALFGKGRGFALALLMGLLALRVFDPYPVEFLRLKTFDSFQQYHPRQVTIRPVTVIDIDERSLREIGQWPWPRSQIAEMVTNLTRMGAVLVAFDVVFAEKDRLTPGRIADSLKEVTPSLRAELKDLPDNDLVLQEAIKNSRVVVGQSGDEEERVYDRPSVKPSIAVIGPPFSEFFENTPFIQRLPGVVRNIEEIEKYATGHGMFSLSPEPDGIVRRVPLLFAHDGVLLPALSVEMLRVATGQRTTVLRTSKFGVENMGIVKGLTLSTDRNGRVWPYFSKKDIHKYVAAADVLNGTLDQKTIDEKIKGKLMIVGASAVGLVDIRAIPTERFIPGVEVHAQLIEGALKNEYLKRPQYIQGAEFLLILLSGLVIIWLVPVVGARWTLLLFLLIVLSTAGASWYLFTAKLTLFDSSYAILSLFLVFMLLTYVGYTLEEHAKQRIREAFGHYLSPEMVEQLAADPDQLKLGGETRNMTVMFSDVRDFTSISEQFTAEGLTTLINKLLTPLTQMIMNHKGTVDKYMGDCIMAFWNAPLRDPDHAVHACLSALHLTAEMAPLNERLKLEAQEEGRKHVPLRVGVGLNTGDIVVGNMGSEMRFDYSVLGDSVNLASRLEGQCKTYAVGIVMGEATYQAAPAMAALELDLIRVKGKKAAVRIYALLGEPEMAESAPFKALAAIHQEMLTAYRSQDWTAARSALEQAASAAEQCDLNLSNFYDVYRVRIAEYAANPPGADWDGVYVATSK